MSKNKNILLLGSELGKGGAERSISLLSYYLEKDGYNVILGILSGKDRTSYYKTCKRIEFVDPPEGTGVMQKIGAWRYRLRKVKQLKKDNNIDICISFLEGPDYVNVLTKGKEKVVLSIRGSKMFDKVISGMMGTVRKKALIPFLYKRADEIVCVTKALAEELNTYFNISYDKLKVIYNFYEIDDLRTRAAEPLTAEEEKIFSKPVIICSGRLHVAKNHDKLIMALKKVKSDTDARLMILGDGELREDLVNQTRLLGMEAHIWDGTYKDADVYLMGFQKNAFKFYRHSEIFALPSLWEGFPNVLAEALICEKKVVTADCPTGPREILNVEGLPHEPITDTRRTEVGTLGPMLYKEVPDSIDIWAKEIIYWLHHEQPASKHYETLISRFSLDTLLKNWHEVID